MSNSAKAYIAAVITAGAVVLAAGLWSWTRPDSWRLGLLLALVIVASTLKIRMPGVTGTFSLNPVFIIMAAAQAGLPGALLVGCAGVLVQSFWWPKRQPTPVQVAFNISNVGISTVVAWLAYGGVQAYFSPTELYAPLAAAAASYFIVNTALVSIVLALVESKPLAAVLSTWLSWALPYYVIGTILASQTAPRLSRPWWGALLSVSGMLLLFLWYRWQMERHFHPPGASPHV